MNQTRSGRPIVLYGGVAVALMIAGCALFQQTENLRLRDQLTAGRVHLSELSRLRQEHLRLTTAANRPKPADDSAETREIARLCALIADSRHQLRLFESGALAGQAGESRTLLPGMLAPEAFEQVGRRSPTQGLQTYYWARLHGKIEALSDATTLDPEAREAAQTLFLTLPASEQANLGTVERLVALVGALQTAPGNTAPFRVAAQAADGTTDVLVEVEFQNGAGGFKSGRLRFRNEIDGWRLVVGKNDVENVARTLANLPAGQRERLGAH